MAELTFRLLGPFEIGSEGAVVSLPGGKPRALLAALILRANQPVSRDVLLDALWPSTPPSSASHALDVHVSRARKALDAVGAGKRLRTEAGAYMLEVRPGELDLARFEELLSEGRESLRGGNPSGARRALEEALRLWRGPALAEFVEDDFARGEAERLDELRMAAHEERLEADLVLGRHGEAIAELRTLVEQYPLRERLWRQLMLALYRAGRQAEALECYAVARRLLVDGLGIEPGDDLRELQQAILRQDTELAGAAARPGLPLPDKPSIAVLPFANLSGDPEQDYFADGMVEDIITGLSRIKWIFVIARNSSFAYRGKAMDVKQIGRELGVRYVVEGSVRRSGNRIRMTAQLIDTDTGTHIWADTYDRALDDVFVVQDELTISVVGVIEPTLRKAEIERARRKRPDSLDAYDLYLRALPLAYTAMPEDADQALTLLERAIELEPDYAAAHATIAWCHEQRYLRGGLHEDAKRAALRHARIAIAVGGDDAAALATAAFVIAVIEYDYETATAAFERSFALSGSSALALGFSAAVSAWKGDDATAVDHATRAIRLSPFDPLLYVPYVGLAYAHFAAGRFEEAATAAGLASQSNPKFTMPYVLHLAALANLGRVEEITVVADRLREVGPDLTVVTAVRSARFANPDKNAELGDALRRAGLPDD